MLQAMLVGRYAHASEGLDAQELAGLCALSVGGAPSSDLLADTIRALGGVEAGERRELPGAFAYTQPIVRGIITLGDTDAFTREIANAVAQTERPIKCVLPGPLTFALLADDQHYGGDLPALLVDAAMALHGLALACQTAGAAWIELHEPMLLRRREFAGLGQMASNIVFAKAITAKKLLYLSGGSADGLGHELWNLRANVIGADCVAFPENVAFLTGSGQGKGKLLGIVDPRGDASGDAHAIMDLLADASFKIGSDRFFIGPSAPLDGLSPEAVDAVLSRLHAIVEAYRARLPEHLSGMVPLPGSHHH